MEKNNRQQVKQGYFPDFLTGLAALFLHRHLLRGDPVPGHGQGHGADLFQRTDSCIRVTHRMLDCVLQKSR
jgi:hypothetical protein